MSDSRSVLPSDPDDVLTDKGDVTTSFADRVVSDEEVALAVLGREDLRVRRTDDGWTLAHMAARHHQEAAMRVVGDHTFWDLYHGSWSVANTAVYEFEEAALAALDHPELCRRPIPAPRTRQRLIHIMAYHHQSVAAALAGRPSLAAIRNAQGWTAAHEAAKHHTSVARTLIDEPELRGLRDGGGWTVAHTAVHNHREAALDVLSRPSVLELTAGRDDDEAGCYWSVLHEAATTHPLVAIVVCLHRNEVAECLSGVDMEGVIGAVRNRNFGFDEEVSETTARALTSGHDEVIKTRLFRKHPAVLTDLLDYQGADEAERQYWEDLIALPDLPPPDIHFSSGVAS